MSGGPGKSMWLSLAGLSVLFLTHAVAVAFFLGDMRADVDNALSVLADRAPRFEAVETRLNSVEQVLSASGVHLQNIGETLKEIKAVLLDNGNTLSVLVARERIREGTPLPPPLPPAGPFVPRPPGQLTR